MTILHVSDEVKRILNPANESLLTYEELMAQRYPMAFFWELVLGMGIRDSVHSIHFHPWRPVTPDSFPGELSYIVKGKVYTLVAPPFEDNGCFVEAARAIMTSKPVRLLNRMMGRNSSGRFQVEWNSEITDWCGVCWKVGDLRGVDFYRLTPVPPNVPDWIADDREDSPFKAESSTGNSNQTT